MTYQVTKTYGHELGLSACFRQWRAKSHCSQLHGYALSFKLTFQTETLNENNWVIDFGSLKPIKAFLEKTFDHKLLVADDDPEKDRLCELAQFGLADVEVMLNVGCEAFAEHVAYFVIDWLGKQKDYYQGIPGVQRVKLVKVECREHGANSAIWMPTSLKLT